MMTQMNFFLKDVSRMLGKRKLRIFYIWLSRAFVGILIYRLERSLFLIFGKFYAIFRILFIPFFNIIQAYTNIDIHYKADIKGGLLVLHPAVGCVISGKASIGENLTLTGGNIIGFNTKKNKQNFKIGDDCSLGANAVIIGPVQLNNKITIGASACVSASFLEQNIKIVGVPAKKLN